MGRCLLDVAPAGFPGPTCGGWSHLRRTELAREERLVAVLSPGVTQLKEAAGRTV